MTQPWSAQNRCNVRMSSWKVTESPTAVPKVSAWYEKGARSYQEYVETVKKPPLRSRSCITFRQLESPDSSSESTKLILFAKSRALTKVEALLYCQRC